MDCNDSTKPISVDANNVTNRVLEMTLFLLSRNEALIFHYFRLRQKTSGKKSSQNQTSLQLRRKTKGIKMDRYCVLVIQQMLDCKE